MTNPVRPDVHLFPHLPALPLAMAVKRVGAKHGHREQSMETWAGIADRTWREWRNGTRVNAQFDVADRVLCATGLIWWEVWNEETVPDPDVLERVTLAFTGEGRGEQLELAA